MTNPEPDPTNAAPSSMPVAPRYEAQPVAAPVVDRPSTITRAVQLMYVGAALSLVGIVVAWLTKSQLRDQVANATPSLTPAQVDAALTVGLVTATVMGLLGVVLWLWMAAANGAGRSWARILSTVLGGLSILSTLASLAQHVTALNLLLQLVSVVLAITILVLLWRPASSAYYQARSARQA